MINTIFFSYVAFVAVYSELELTGVIKEREKVRDYMCDLMPLSITAVLIFSIVSLRSKMRSQPQVTEEFFSRLLLMNLHTVVFSLYCLSYMARLCVTYVTERDYGHNGSMCTIYKWHIVAKVFSCIANIILVVLFTMMSA